MNKNSMAGFSLIELLVGTVIFTIIAGTVFSVLMSSQLRYSSENNVAQAFQQGNVAIDQITRDIHSAGYPPEGALSNATAGAHPELYALPFAWSPNYATPAACIVNVSCAVPGDYDLILESDYGQNSGAATGVQWIRYSLQGTTLMRGVVTKVPFADPVASTTASLTPYLENVQNGNKSLPIFSYTWDNINPVPRHIPSNIREVNISLIVQGTQPDPQTHQYRTVTLTGQAVRFNPNQCPQKECP
jgi:type II secretory pathway component PulJ